MDKDWSLLGKSHSNKKPFLMPLDIDTAVPRMLPSIQDSSYKTSEPWLTLPVPKLFFEVTILSQRMLMKPLFAFYKNLSL